MKAGPSVIAPFDRHQDGSGLRLPGLRRLVDAREVHTHLQFEVAPAKPPPGRDKYHPAFAACRIDGSLNGLRVVG